LTPLEDAKIAVDEYMKKEVEMLYKISLLEKSDAEKVKQWILSHPHYQRLNNLSVFT
jgi:hypothetical protein